MTSFSFCGITLAASCFLLTGGPAREGVALPDTQVQTSSGPVRFHNMSIRRGRRFHISGLATNLTDRKWTSVIFDLELLDIDGKTIGHVPLKYGNLAAGQSREFTADVENPESRDFRRYQVLYRTGEIDVTYMLTLLKPVRNRLLHYEDQNATFSFAVSDTCIEVKFKNNLSSPARIDWSTARFSDIFEQVHAVTHGGEPTLEIPPFGLFHDSLAPEKNRLADGASYEGWRSGGIVPRTQDAGEIKGRTVSLLLPVRFGEVVTPYQFVFQVAETLF